MNRRPSVRPNVLLIMVDQLAAQWLPAYGHELVRAPNLDKLAASSVVFDAAYCPSPLCAPSRSAMLTGRYASTVEVFDNAAELRAAVPTLAHFLRAAGYRTCLAGKMHFVGPDQLHGFERRLTTDVYPATLDWTPDWTREVADRLPWYHSVEAVQTPAATVASMQTDYDDEVAFHAVRYLQDLAREGSERPFLLTVSFTNPHDPWEVPPRYWDLYQPDAIEPPAVPATALERADPHSRRLAQMSGLDQVEISDEQVRRARHGYYAAISYVDERIGSVLSALHATGLERDTVIVFTADHGEFLGERGLWYKMSFLEPAARVPLFVGGRGLVAGGRAASPVSLVDLVPTLLEVADVPAGGVEMDGSSLIGQLGAPASTERGPVICEYHAEGVTAPAAMIRSPRHKLIVCRTDPDQLFDLEADPLELSNLAGDPSHASVVDALRAELAARLDLDAIESRVLESQRERHLAARALATGAVTPWDFQPYVDASKQYVRTQADLYHLQRLARLESG
ncbi:MAG TPA: choline-sulfatase [Solirubrobacteraceae bacterium]|nr:choline-sulfatase [Solirubrobacteraceae bacterium]